MSTPSLDQVRELARHLSWGQKLILIEELVSQVRYEAPSENKPFRTFSGALAHLGPAPSAEEIDEVRRDMLTPRDCGNNPQ